VRPFCSRTHEAYVMKCMYINCHKGRKEREWDLREIVFMTSTFCVKSVLARLCVSAMSMCDFGRSS